MEFQTFSFPQSMQAYFGLFFFFFVTLSFFLFSVLIYLLRQRIWCSCDICYDYLSSNWSKQFNNLCDWYSYLLQKSPSQTIHVHVLNNTITANPDNVEYMLKTRFDNYPKGKSFSMILGDLLGKGIFNVDGEEWMFQRKMASLELANISIRAYAFEIVSAEIQCRLLPLLSSFPGSVLDLQDVFRRFSFDNICKFSFGLDPGCLELSSSPISRFAEAFDLASKLSAERAMAPLPLVWKIKRLFNIGSEKILKEAIEVVNVLAMEVIMQKRKLGYSTHKDLISRFMAISNDDSYLRDIVISFILAGRDTMASALTTFFWLLTNNPQVILQIRNEADQFMEPDQGFISYDQIRKMHYLHAAVYESLRLYPPVQFDSKFACHDDILPDGTFIPKGTRVTYHPYAMGRMETIWGQDCIKFKPERWLKNDIFCPQCPFKYPVFQAGVRVCLGKELALVEMKMVVLAVLRRFDIELVAPMGAPLFDPGLTATVRGGLHVVVRERWDIATA
ncbi:hypothetical protein PTKIN_Ptkin16aG0078800 [Pterospermum kingtungense]